MAKATTYTRYWFAIPYETIEDRARWAEAAMREVLGGWLPGTTYTLIDGEPHVAYVIDVRDVPSKKDSAAQKTEGQLLAARERLIEVGMTPKILRAATLELIEP
jgi:hypothetical protein